MYFLVVRDYFTPDDQFSSSRNFPIGSIVRTKVVHNRHIGARSTNWRDSELKELTSFVCIIMSQRLSYYTVIQRFHELSHGPSIIHELFVVNICSDVNFKCRKSFNLSLS